MIGRFRISLTEEFHTDEAWNSSLRGMVWAVSLVAAWILSLILLLRMPLEGSWLSPLVLLPAILLRAFLQTGLFIVGHDAMHGSLLPDSPLWNERIGRLALTLYAGLPWEPCCRNHGRHHLAPGSLQDPDHHGGHPRGPLLWYLRFMASYLTPTQMGALLSGWLLCLCLLRPFTPHPLASLLLFWTLPLLVSSLQLFVVGTYLPHREASGRSTDRHHAASLSWPAALSFLACFHFGYHWEHHQNPSLPWHRLPSARRRLMTDPASDRCGLAMPNINR